MASATWSPAATASTATFNRNQTLAELQANATTYDDPSVTYDSISVYYDGYNPIGTTPEGAAGAVWTREAE